MSEADQLFAQRLLKRFFWINGVVVPCVLENILLLWALHNGLGDAHVAVLSSFTMLAMPMMFLGKQLSASIGAPRAWGFSWFCRYLFILAMLPAPWLRSTALAPVVPWLLTICFFGLFSMRSMGMINNIPVIGEATSKADQGSFQAGVSMRANISYFLTLAVIIGVLSWRDSISVFQAILLFGSLLGMYSARMLYRLPEMDGLRGSARMGIGSVARHIRGNHLLGRLALSWCATFTATALIVPISMLAVKQGYRVADDTALFFTLLELAGAIIAAYALTIIADHTGPRPILVLGLGMFWLVAGFWAFAPQNFMPALVGLAFILAGVGRHSIMMALNHYLLATTATRERMGVSMVMQMLSGATSGLAGMLIAGGLIRGLSLRLAPDSGLELYQAYYRTVLFLMLPLSLAVWRLPKLKNWTVRNVIGLIFSIRDLRTLITLNQLRSPNADDEHEVARIEQLTLLASRRSEPALREFLANGRLAQQAAAIRALGRIPFDEQTCQALIRVLETGIFTNAWRAAELLGQRRITAAIPALRKALPSPDPFLRGKCMVALARLQDRESFPIIRDIFRKTDNPRIAIHGAQALEYLKQPEDVRMILNKTVEQDWPTPIRHEILLSACGILGLRNTAFRLLKNIESELSSPIQPPSPQDIARANPNLSAIGSFLLDHDWSTLPESVKLVIRQGVEHSR